MQTNGRRVTPAENNDLFLRQFGGAVKTTEKSAPV